MPSSESLFPAAPAELSLSALRVVAIGGGTGLSTLLRSLRRYVTSPGIPPESSAGPCLISDLAAVVTVTDDGGSSGQLRKDFNMLPPGDLRNCMVALSQEEALISRLFGHRFRQGSLEGHSLGNLFVAALAEITGDFGLAIQQASQILATRGRLYPSTLSNATLVARMDDGSIVRGETSISTSPHRICQLMLEPQDAAPLPQTLEAIERADLITVGPGSLFTSLITNLLVKGIPEALASARGVRVYICNLMTQANESLHLTASQHIERIYEHAGRPIFDYALVNTAPLPQDVLRRYAVHGAQPIEPDCDRIEALGVRCIPGDFAGIGSSAPTESNVIRHIGDKLTHTLLQLGRDSRKR